MSDNVRKIIIRTVAIVLAALMVGSCATVLFSVL